MQCLECGNQTSNPKFCSRSCSAKYNNTHRTKKQYTCQQCGMIIGEGYRKFGERKYCDKCGPNYIDWSTITIGELKAKRLYQFHSRIRQLAQKVCSNRSHTCARCGYNKHVEVCHIKPIKDFNDDTLVSIINNEHNLIELCPNCHWEFDNGLWSL